MLASNVDPKGQAELNRKHWLGYPKSKEGEVKGRWKATGVIL